MNPSESEIYEFGPFRFDTSNLMLFKDGEVLPLAPKALDTLAVLVRNQGKVVEKAALIQAVWPDTFVEENNLSQNISALRKALGDPDYIQTVPRRGFRFVAPAPRTVPSQPDSLAETRANPRRSAASPERALGTERRPARWPLWVMLAAALSIAGLGVRTYLARRSGRGSGKIMMVVLPFLNLSGDPAREYLADGMTEEMITQLGSLDPAHLGVIARTSAMQYKGTHKDVARIAQELDVNYVLEGSVRRAGDRVRVTAQLIQTSDQTHIWADSFDRNLSDILQLESDVARAIAAKTELALSKQAEARLAVTPHVDAAAHEAYLLGLQSWNLRTREGVTGAITDFKRAIAIDPNYALAYAGIARAYSLAPVFEVAPPSESLPEAREAATRAIALDDSLADAHTTLAFIDAHYDYDWKNAEREFRRAIELNPSYAYAHFFYSNSYLSPLGLHEQAIEEMKKAIELDPLSLPIRSFSGRTFVWAHRYDEALAQFQKANQMDPNFAINHERMAHLFADIGKFNEAIDEETKARVLSGEDPQAAVQKGEALRQAFRAGGARGYWKQALELSVAKENPPEAYVDRYGLAILHARLGEKEKALSFLEKADAEHELAMTEAGVEPGFDTLRSDPNFAAVLKHIGLPR